MGASVIGVDVLLDRASDPSADQALESAISQANAPVILVSNPGRSAIGAICDDQPAGTLQPDTLDRYVEVATIGHGALCLDSLDDVARRAPVNRASAPSFAETITNAYSATEPGTAAWLNIPFQPGEEALWPFRTFSASMIDVLPASWIEGRIVLIGRISPYSGDFVSTPLRFSTQPVPVEPKALLPQAELPGLVVHAFTISAMLDGRRGHHLTVWGQIPYVVLGALLGAGLVLLRLRLMVTLGGLAVLLVAYWWLVFALFNATSGAWLPPFTGFASALLIVSGGLFAALEREERDKRRFVQEGFSHFLSKKRVEEIIQSPSILTLSAEEREMTFLFTDLEGFTTLVDTMEPTQLAPTLNGYLDKIIDVVARHDGTVDKIVGDAVHAMFSAPLEVPEHRLKAVQCALDILDVSNAYQAQVRAQGVDFGRTRIGISCGKALVGNFGSSRRFDYTAHGSTVNLAARLEAANKSFGTSICVSESALADHPSIAYRIIGDIPVRGIVEPVRVFEALRAAQCPPEVVQRYADAYALLDTDPETAAAQFRRLQRDHPDDGLIAYQLASVEDG